MLDVHGKWDGAGVRVVVESDPKRRKAAAFAPDWPGLERGGKTEDEAVSALAAYARVTNQWPGRAGLHRRFSPMSALDVVERYEGTGSTDFWGISFGPGRWKTRISGRDDPDEEPSTVRAGNVSMAVQREPIGPTNAISSGEGAMPFMPGWTPAPHLENATGLCRHCPHHADSHRPGGCSVRAGWRKRWRRCPCPGYEPVPT